MMIITHSIKFNYPKSSLSGLCVLDVPKISNKFLYSQTININKRLFGGPVNAADHRNAVEYAVSLENDRDFKGQGEDELSSIALNQFCKQMLIKHSKFGFLNHTPVTSCALIYELKNRLSKIKNRSNHYSIHATASGIANRGELGTLTSGRIRSFIASNLVYKAVASNDSQPIKHINKIVVTGKLTDCLLNSGLVSVGVPALPGMGGVIDLIEYKTGAENLSFAVGFNNLNYSLTGVKSTNYTYKTPFPKAGVPNIDSSEINGMLDFCLVITGYSPIHEQVIIKEVSQLTRICGGQVWDLQIKSNIEGFYSFVVEDNEGSGDMLDYAINNHCLPVASGVVFLEAPKERKNRRNNDYLHVFTESLFSQCKLVNSNTIVKNMLWSRHCLDNAVYWGTEKRNNIE